MMTIEQLKKLLNVGEWNDVAAYETVCSFSNTHGGWLIFGVSQKGDGFEITGVDSPDKIQNDFLSVLHAGGKINHDVKVTEERLLVKGKRCSKEAKHLIRKNPNQSRPKRPKLRPKFI